MRTVTLSNKQHEFLIDMLQNEITTVEQLRCEDAEEDAQKQVYLAELHELLDVIT